ncbi:MAG: right-handed parallel beta-helix repeat-containing protein [Acidimicrobiia bacterium]|nr:right-handed parallel beta-helix repeat-containing protein [Acidimicrobiia bacterium]
MKYIKFFVIAIVSILLLSLNACSSDSKVLQKPKILSITNGQSIQSAIDKSKPGDLVLIEPGKYSGSIVIKTKDITLRGLDRNSVIIDGSYEQDNGIIVASDGVRIENLTVQKFRDNGVLIQGGYEYPNNISTKNPKKTSNISSAIERFSVQYINANSNGISGISSSLAKNGVIENTFTYANAKAGIYIGQCKPCNIDVDNNYATFNGLGFQGENSASELYVYQNEFTNNQSGIYLLNDSNNKEVFQGNTVIAANLVSNNNNEDAPNINPDIFGYGVVIAGGTSNSIVGNSIIDHIVGGIILTSQKDFLPMNNKISENFIGKQKKNLVGNGAIDIQYFISGRPNVMSLGNCFKDNTFGSSNIEKIESVLTCQGATPGPFAASFRPKSKTKTPPVYSSINLSEITEPQMPGDLKQLPKQIVKILSPDLTLLKVPTSK